MVIAHEQHGTEAFNGRMRTSMAPIYCLSLLGSKASACPIWCTASVGLTLVLPPRHVAFDWFH